MPLLSSPGLPAATEAVTYCVSGIAGPQRQLVELALLGQRGEELEALAVGGAPDPGRSCWGVRGEVSEPSLALAGEEDVEEAEALEAK